MTRDDLRNGCNELSGGLADLGTFLPLALSLIAVCRLDATTVFLCAGLLYIAAGSHFRIPVPVQPLKATSALAIAMAATAADVAATALGMSAILLAVAALRLDRRIAALFPRPVVRGIQLGLGILLVKGGMKLVLAAAPPIALAGGAIDFPPGLLLGGATAGIIVLSGGNRRFPAALAALGFGAACGVLLPRGGSLDALLLGPSSLPGPISLADVDLGMVLFVLLLPQIPLTFANSIVAAADTCRACYGERASRATTRQLAASLGIANLVAGLVGGMPMCHGSGGVTAHHRFGARTGKATIIAGALFVAAALLFGRSIGALAAILPLPVLGALLVSVGIAHGMLVRDVLSRPREAAVALAIGGLTLLSGNLSYAFGAGIVLHRLLDRLATRAEGAHPAREAERPAPLGEPSRHHIG